MDTTLRGLYRALIDRLYAQRRLVALLYYVAATTFAYFAAYLVRFEFVWRPAYTEVFLGTLPLLLGVRLVLGAYFRIGAGRWRFTGTHDLLRLTLVTSGGSAVFLVLVRPLGLAPAVPLSVTVLEWFLTMSITGGTWLVYRLSFEHLRQREEGSGTSRRVLVVGAGEAGQMLVHEMLRNPMGLEPVGFVDDDPHKWGLEVHGVEVVGAVSDLPAVAPALEADELVIAIPNAPPERLRQIVAYCEATDLGFKLLPGIQDVLEGRATTDQLRSVRVEDLLGRDPVKLDLPKLRGDLTGEVVLVTGAAGSIGSELCRQIARHGPTRLIVLDQAETPLYYLELELREAWPEVELHPVIADVVDEAGLRRVFERYRPSRVFHAAAYKHVPMMELNPGQALRTNFLGSSLVAGLAGEYGAERFVLVSTDKAVAPANIMGASKRLAEMAVLRAQKRYPGTSYGAVRFGNVLGSAGSVIPIFRRQLENGKPLTVTHPEVTRYFMTIPEAVQLILQASLLEELRGSIAMLEMGEPVKIVDLARNLLRLSGRPFRVGSTVVYTGLRPGEKLHEVLVDVGEETVSTDVDKVRVIVSHAEDGPAWEERIERWVRRVEEGDAAEVVGAIGEIWPEVHPIGLAERYGTEAEASRV